MIRLISLIVFIVPFQLATGQSLLFPDSTARILYLSDTSGKLVNLHDFSGKVVVADFWFTGCSGCAGFYERVFKPLKRHFKDEDRVVFISISTDTESEMWKRSIFSGIYTFTDALNLYTGGKGRQHPIIKHYGISAYPCLLLIGKNGDERLLKHVNTQRCCTLEDLVAYIAFELKQ